MKKRITACTLGSGAAFGYAHIGVLQYLEDQDIQVSGIAGTSMGAIIGGLYAYGYRAKELEDLALGLNTLDIAKFFFPSFPRGGIIDSEQVKKFISSLVGDALIENLPIPFRSVATDIVTGDEVVFDSGPLIDGMIASMSIQGMFKPYRCKGLYLCDGGMCNPVPWNLGNDMGNVNIIVNVLPLLGYTADGKRAVLRISEISGETTPEREPGFTSSIKSGEILDTTRDLIHNLRHRKVTIKQLHSELWHSETSHSPSLMDVLMNWTFMTSVERRIPVTVRGVKQVIIKPDMEGYNPLDFKQGKTLIRKGYDCALKQEQLIRKLTGT